MVVELVMDIKVADCTCEFDKTLNRDNELDVLGAPDAVAVDEGTEDVEAMLVLAGFGEDEIEEGDERSNDVLEVVLQSELLAIEDANDMYSGEDVEADMQWLA